MNGGVKFRLEDLRDVLLQAGDIAMAYFSADKSVVVKPDGSPLSVADVEIDDFLRNALSRLEPRAAWLSEESSDSSQRSSSQWVWVVDPIDGTKEYIRGRPEFAVSVGLVRDHQVAFGGVFNPASGEGAVASVAGEALFWGMALGNCSAQHLESATASVSRTEAQQGVLSEYVHLVATAKPVGSVAYKLLRVAGGIEDLTFSVQNKNEWDICGGVALLAAVGKQYCRFDQRPILFNQTSPRIRSGAVAGDPILTRQFLEFYASRTR